MNVINQQILSYQQSDAGLLEQIEKETKNLEKHKADLTGLYEEKSQLDEKLDQADDVLDEAKNSIRIWNRILPRRNRQLRMPKQILSSI